MTIYRVDLISGNDGDTGLSFAQRLKTLSHASGLVAAGDTVYVMGTNAPIDLGQTATWTGQGTTPGGGVAGSKYITLTSAVNLAVYNSTTWVQGTGTTQGTTSTSKSGGTIATLSTTSLNVTGLLGYFATGNLAVSAYQTVTFWIKTSSTVAAGVLTLTLCSDTAGTTALNTFTLPALSVGWNPITIDNGSALSSTTVKSVALNSTGSGIANSNLFTIDRINLATSTTASSTCLTLNHLIGKNTTGESFFAIRDINVAAATVTFDSDPTSTGATRGYGGASSTSEVWTLLPNSNSSGYTSIPAQTISSSGTAANPINWQFGYDQTNMTTQNLQTWIDGQVGSGTGLTISGSHNTVNLMGLSRWNSGLSISTTGNNNTLTSIPGANNNVGFGITNTGLENTITSAICSANSGYGCSTSLTSSNINGAVTLGSVTANNNGQTGISITAGSAIIGTLISNNNNNGGAGGLSLNIGTPAVIQSFTANNNLGPAVFYDDAVSGHTILNLNTSYNGGATLANTVALNLNNNQGRQLYLYNAYMQEANQVNSLGAGNSAQIWSQAGTSGTMYMTVTGSTFTNGATETLTFSNPPATVTYTQGAGSSAAIVATNLAANITSNGTLSGDRFVASSNGAVIAINFPYGTYPTMSVSGADSASHLTFPTVGPNLMYSYNGNTLGNPATVPLTSGVANPTPPVGSTIWWSLSPQLATGVGASDAFLPLRLALPPIAVNAGSLVTVTAQCQVTNTGITAQIRVPGGYPAGPATDQIYTFATTGGSANTWETLTVSWTPSLSGGVPIYFEAWGGTTYTAFVSLLTVSQ